MAETTGITTRVLDALAVAGVLTTEQLATAEGQAASNGGNAGHVVIKEGLAAADDIASVLEEALGVPRVDLESYAPDEAALELVPPEIARELSIVPLFEIEGVLTVAIGDASGVFDLDALGARLGLEVEAVLAEPLAVRAALAQHYPAPPPPARVGSGVDEAVTGEPSTGEPSAGVPVLGDAANVPGTEDAATGAESALDATVEATPVQIATADDTTPWIDLDVLAVADPARMALLVTEILEQAVRLGATKIHILPYKDDFFVVFRVNGRLRQIGAAPLSLQDALVEGVRSFMRLPAPGLGQPSVGRLHTEIAGVEVTLTLSAVKTISGHRLVVSIDEGELAPRPIAELGVGEQERRALEALIERGAGLLLIVSPVGEGASETYYSVLAHAAAAGRTSYSVERSVGYEIPAAAQVPVPPGSPVAAVAYFSAGLRQDTDVMGADPLESREDVRLAIEATAQGKLVVATFAASRSISAVRRLLDMGVEPTSLASALTMVVAQRLVRTVCPSCATDDDGELAARLPGNESGMPGRIGSGCSACHDSGYGGVAGLFEVTPVTDELQVAIERAGSAEEIESAALASGMRSFAVAGLDALRDGSVSAAELDRVLRFAE